jgi:hypothetical protein
MMAKYAETCSEINISYLRKIYSSRTKRLSTFHRVNKEHMDGMLKYNITQDYILPVVAHGGDNWSLITREGNRLRVFENRVLRRIFKRRRVDVAGGCFRTEC